MIGTRVRDYPSNTVTVIRAAALSFDVDGHMFVSVKVGSNVPLDPTKDGSFPDRWRNLFEIGAPDLPRPADWTY